MSPQRPESPGVWMSDICAFKFFLHGLEAMTSPELFWVALVSSSFIIFGPTIQSTRLVWLVRETPACLLNALKAQGNFLPWMSEFCSFHFFLHGLEAMTSPELFSDGPSVYQFHYFQAIMLIYFTNFIN